MSGGISSGTVAAHAGLQRAEGSILVIEVDKFRIHQVVDIEEGCLTVPDGDSSLTEVQARSLTVVERTVSM